MEAITAVQRSTVSESGAVQFHDEEQVARRTPLPAVQPELEKQTDSSLVPRGL
ncbi:hypothetical protein LJK88_43165 [Paenibacillus sp. P26]|nr:hypothetical protein LJK88_43165 [Paenibacillus sp. P26]